ncbi:MAG: GNAT family N-acetyltransferase [Gammaproteobacteria bacterium]|uniref:GNAT family N-acetyltransferase n=1 Tax=Azohydromonas sp. TaxID=1872666 RepID=UPI002CA3B73A|nr:GNAT family N-acetyltransferase [Azohydromonas sp.]HMM87156.1 GNAT family N-acetyltransferase [Azohydromonas sp.]
MPPIRVESLRVEHLPRLAAVLRHEAVYEHIGGEVPSLDDFVLGLGRALAGPPPSRPRERWLNYLLCDAHTGRMVGRLEATVVPGRAEVAFLVDPALWGRGYARAGLAWLHDEVVRVAGVVEFWATTVPANTRCQALLRRSGYAEVAPASAPALASYEPGDLVFRRRAAA